MDLEVPKGKYVVAVSGGVDSAVLLDLLVKQAKSPELRVHTDKNTLSSKLSARGSSSLKLVVAHFNHGIRPDSDKDEQLARRLANNYGLALEVGYGRLGAGTSEEKAREARYKFLQSIKKESAADAIITAHHQDDLLETAFINIIRGTGRRGLTAISDNPDIVRPLLDRPKKDILEYAKKNKLEWRDDPTNNDDTYLRNYVRNKVLPLLKIGERRRLLRNIDDLKRINRTLNLEIAILSQKIINGSKLDRARFIALPSEIAKEVMMLFLTSNKIREFDKPTVERLVVTAKTAKPGSRHDINRGAHLEITASKALLKTTVNR